MQEIHRLIHGPFSYTSYVSWSRSVKQKTSLCHWFVDFLWWFSSATTNSLAQPRRQPCSPHPHGDNVVQFQVFLIGNGKMSFPNKKNSWKWLKSESQWKKKQWEKLKQTWKSSQLLILSPLQQLVQTFNIWSTQAPKRNAKDPLQRHATLRPCTGSVKAQELCLRQ